MQCEKNIFHETVAVQVTELADEDVDNSGLYKTSKESLKRRKHKKRHHNKYKRKVKVDRCENMETLVVTQKVKVKEHKYKCIINLTNTCEHKSSRDIKVERKPPFKHANAQRIVPRCFRKCYRCEPSNKRSKARESPRHKKNKRTPETKCELDSLSSISLLSLDKYSEMYYEDISSDSFTVQSDDDIDTLIKRTKDRERRQSKSFDSLLSWKIRTPKFFESISDAETVILPRDTSQHSAALVLEPQLEIYSPTRPTTSPDLGNNRYMNMTENNHNKYNYIGKNYEDFMFLENPEHRKYSPALTCYGNCYICTGNIKTNACCNIKHEPYSPTDTPMSCGKQSLLPYEVHIKFEQTENPKFLEVNYVESTKIIKVEEGLNSTSLALHNIPQNVYHTSNSSGQLFDINVKTEFCSNIK